MLTDPSDKDDELTSHLEKSVGPVVDGARRRFTRASLAVSGVLMSLSSRSVLACEAISPSGFCSVNQSRHGSQHESRCRGPYYWSGECGWPVSKEIHFNDIFYQCPTRSPYHQQKCHDIVCGRLQYDSSPNQCLGQYLIAAYLNACMGWSEGFLSTSECINLGNEWLRTGVFRPTAHVTWNTAQLLQYFQNTQS